jgi:hypothetical protein
MTDAAAFASASLPRSIPLSELLPWAIFAGLISLIALYFVGAEQGAVSLFSGMYVPEFVHDGRPEWPASRKSTAQSHSSLRRRRPRRPHRRRLPTLGP